MIILFRLGIEWFQSMLLNSQGDFSNAPFWQRFIMPLVGVFCILIVAKLTGFKHYRLGIPFVIHRIKTHFGLIPLRATINQFFGGMFALASGFVVGREGPSVHLGAASSSFLGQWLRLPYNSIRILAGCGIAAGISASFNTPLAAVIFVMEVVLREYRIHIFVPVMLAAACGSVMTRIVFGDAHELYFFSFAAFSQWMYAYLIVFGVALGALATLFNRQLMRVMRLFRPVGMVWRLILAALITGTAGLFLPDAMSADFDSVRRLFDSNPDAILIALLLVVKMLLAITAIGLGIPGGIIGPVMLIGMLAGALLLSPLAAWLDIPDYISSFALLGLAGMLTAVLHAPLAALTAVMELSYSPQIIVPAMFVIVPAYVTSTQFFKNRSVFLQQLDYQKLTYAVNPIRETLEKVGVLSVMETQFKQFHDAPQKAIADYLAEHPTDIVVQRHSFELAANFKLAQFDTSLDHDADAIVFVDLAGISAQTTLAEAYDKMKNQRAGAVYIYDTNPDEVMGVLSWAQVQKHLHQGQI
ncbi:chloride channel protein [Alteromonas sediminis]|uniref:Chloride channel protein n=1 Tax=Alteromonas sediminis TaxID=2259342 RepID=A0A3N5XZT9_9ALTE|nr:chloride channel protein [Alteromonas sediminis]RPJ66113.1 chloride channel protein [Alteromonas sediminis]